MGEPFRASLVVSLPCHINESGGDSHRQNISVTGHLQSRLSRHRR